MRRQPAPTAENPARFDRRTILRGSAAGLAIPTAVVLGMQPAAGAAIGAAERGVPAVIATEGNDQVTDSETFDPGRLTQLNAMMAAHIERGRLPGLVFGISRGGETIIEAIGTMGFESDAPMQRDAIFRIASVTKPITAVAAFLLIEDGVVRLDDPVDVWLPELANRQVLRAIDAPLDDTVPANRPLTLRDLLTFRAGYGAIFTPPGQSPLAQALIEANVAAGPFLPTMAPDEFMAAYGQLPLAHQPGERWLYNTGSDLAGVLIARASGMSLGAFFQERIFAPLGMEDTGFSIPASELDRLPESYWTNFETGKFEVFDSSEGSRFASPPAFESGAGGLVSTVDDLLIFGQMMLANGAYADGGKQLLSQASIALMTTDQLTAKQKAASTAEFFPGFFDSHGWGFGMAINTRRDNIWATPGRYGWDGGYGTSWTVDPAEGLVGVLLTQRAWDEPGYPASLADFWTGVYQAV